ncbi:MFS transporter [Candidatus Rhabdochlamydia sp. T3358]|uniref:MFS transporter n=1 Tax=Candidatus Rhabdochlamydia sp. T3358 TaxID=2099795 RepID=UPI0010B7D978|nr:MFS transporter [Candidatus Rhabdochlamydia sp. T3358]VHO03124.1 Tetracycline resistance protein, class C [Candidatus Rhabdochlamydia sp. T3358]
MTNYKSSFYIALLVAFIDNMGIGLVFPIFSSMLFDNSFSLVPLETSSHMRGIWLGFLLSLMPLAQFFSAPIWGAISDNKGRKKPLQTSLIIAFLGYVIAFFGVLLNSIFFLLASRAIIGFASGNMSIVQASIADLSSQEQKAKNFSLYAMALGAGFALSPFIGGSLSSFGYSYPFLFAGLIVAVNLLFVFFFFKETHHSTFKRKLSFVMGISQLKKAFHLKGLRVIFLCSFLCLFAWTYFFEFIPVYLITRFHFSPIDLGLFFGAAGGYYALSAGLLIRPFIKRFKPEVLFLVGMFLTALTILTMPFISSLTWLFVVMFFVCFFTSFVMPTATTLVSNKASAEVQGEALGIFTSVNAAALILSPLFSGSIVGAYPMLPMWVGGSIKLLSALIGIVIFRKSFLSCKIN